MALSFDMVFWSLSTKFAKICANFEVGKGLRNLNLVMSNLISSQSNTHVTPMFVDMFMAGVFTSSMEDRAEVLDDVSNDVKFRLQPATDIGDLTYTLVLVAMAPSPIQTNTAVLTTRPTLAPC